MILFAYPVCLSIVLKICFWFVLCVIWRGFFFPNSSSSSILRLTSLARSKSPIPTHIISHSVSRFWLRRLLTWWRLLKTCFHSPQLPLKAYSEVTWTPVIDNQFAGQWRYRLSAVTAEGIMQRWVTHRSCENAIGALVESMAGCVWVVLEQAYILCQLSACRMEQILVCFLCPCSTFKTAESCFMLRR